MTKRILEVCAADLPSVLAAAQAGAPRIELCAALAVGGVTPSVGMMKVARQIFDGKIHVLIRPRGGDFVYNDIEKQSMIDDIIAARQAGMDGVVIGSLNPDGSIDKDFTTRAIKAARPLSVTFHRAFDRCTDAQAGLELLIQLGVDRILTSGLAPSALHGAEALAKLHVAAAGRIGIIAAAGVNEKNVAEILRMTNVDEVHSSCRSSIKPTAQNQAQNQVKMGDADDDTPQSSSVDVIKAIMNQL